MALHWSENHFDYKALDEACQFFDKNLKRFGRFSDVYILDKYGTIRIRLDYFTVRTRVNTLLKLLDGYNRLVFNLVTVRAVKKWPHIQAEMLDDTPFQELLYQRIKKYIGFKDHWITYSPNKDQETTEL